MSSTHETATAKATHAVAEQHKRETLPDPAPPGSTFEPILRFFAWQHLPSELQKVSQPFAALASLVHTLPRNAERSVALRKLLEAKDAAVRAALP